MSGTQEPQDIIERLAGGATFAPVEKHQDIVPYSRWESRATALNAEFANAAPFPSVVLDDFLSPEAARRALQLFPSLRSDGWIHYVRPNERKFGMRDRRTLPEPIIEILDELNSDRFVGLVSHISGIPFLRADASLEGSGAHQVDRGGFLNIHADFNVHPHLRSWQRQLNLIIYLNPDWDEAWGGHLELWDSRVQRCVRRIAPVFNRAILFRTNDTSYHGHPDPLLCPGNVTRKSLALYYYSVESTPPRVRSTDHRARPGDTARRRATILLDKIALTAYDRTKRRFGFDDTFADRVLRTLSRLRPRE